MEKLLLIWLKDVKKVYPDSNAATAWERLKSKNKPIFASSMVKFEKQLRGLSLKKDEHPEV
jgi:hypothetical protein